MLKSLLVVNTGGAMYLYVYIEVCAHVCECVCVHMRMYVCVCVCLSRVIRAPQASAMEKG